MLITPDTDDGSYKIKSYAHGSITINEETLTTPFLISATHLIKNWKINPTHFSPENFDFLSGLKPQVFIFGTGETAIFPNTELYQFFLNLKIGLECMTTSAACRTYNLLVSERRKVVAGLIL